jgi:hypothetical protein
LEYNQTVQQSFMDFKTTYDSIRKKVLCNILIEFRVPKKKDLLVERCLNKMKDHTGKHLSDNFLIQNGIR